eukprot:Skav217835  [mRNA]  locus=scaffold889:554779:556363:+ [translate_table: standard]
MSMCNQLGARRLRPSSAPSGVVWREQKAFPVPKVATSQWPAPQPWEEGWPPPVSGILRRGASEGGMRRAAGCGRASVTGIFAEMAEKQH